MPVHLFVFDVLWADGRDVRPMPLRERKRLLRGLLSFRDPLSFTEHRDADGEGYFREACLHAALAALERPDPPFEPVRGLPRSGLHWVEPRLVAQVGFTEWTADGRLRHPRFRGLRRDKNPPT